LETIAETFLLILLLPTLITYTPLASTQLAQANSTTIIVPDDYPTIQEAINAAQPGDTIKVKPGTYNECIKINKPLKLLGNGSHSTVIKSTNSWHTVEISRGTVNVTVKGFKIVSTSSSWAGIFVRGIENYIYDNVIVNHKFGIKIYDSYNNVLRNNLMADNKFNLYVWGISLHHFIHDIDSSNKVNGKPVYYLMNKHNLTVDSNAGYVALINCTNIVVKNLNLTNNLSAVLLAYTNNTAIFNITATKNERSIYLICSHNNFLINNRLSQNYWSGITLISSTNNYIAGNRLHSQIYGISLSHTDTVLPNKYSNNNTIEGNSIIDNTYGIAFTKASYNTIAKNTLTSNNYALLMESSSFNTFHQNLIHNNTYGTTFQDSSNNTFYHNEFVNNTNDFHLDDSQNVWDGGFPCGGNYCSYTGVDANEDGIGDTPHTLNENNKDNHPLMNPLPSLQKIDLNISLSKTETYPNHPIHIIITLRNRKNTNQTVIVTCKNTIELLNHAIVNLLPNTTTTLNLSWTVNIASIQLIIAEVTFPSNITSSKLAFALLNVKKLGDINGDGKIDLKDLEQAALAFGAFPQMKSWNPNADLNLDNKIDILDIALIAKMIQL